MDVRLTTVGSTRFLTNSNDGLVGKSLEVYREWSHGELDLLSKLLQPINNVVEIGANIWAHTLFIARDIGRPRSSMHLSLGDFYFRCFVQTWR
jgi:hypothetical protein